MELESYKTSKNQTHKQKQATKYRKLSRKASPQKHDTTPNQAKLMEHEEHMTSSPFWVQSRQAGSRHRRSSSSSSTSFLFNSGVLLVFLLAVAVAFIFIIIPSIRPFTSQIFKPQTVKKSWDSLNLILVLFAILCGFLCRNNNESTATPTSATAASTSFQESYKFENRSESFPKSNPETPKRFWYDQGYSNINNGGGLSRFRSFSSHPDLTQAEESLWMNRDDNRQWRSYDDTHLYHNRFSSFDHHHQQLPRPQPEPEPKLEIEQENVADKEHKKVDNVNLVKDDNVISVEESKKEVIYTPPPPPEEEQPSPPVPPSLTKVGKRRARRYQQERGEIYLRTDPEGKPPPLMAEEPLPPPLPPPPRQTTVERRRVKRNNQENNGNYRNRDLEVKPTPSLPSPSPEPPAPWPEEGGWKSEKKRGGASATKEFFISLRRKRKKKQRQKSVENLDSFFNYESSYPLPQPASLIPPPPPPPPPFLQSIFSPKKRKAKKIHSLVPPPPPPPPPARTQKLSTSRTRNVPFASEKPPLPVRIQSYGNVEEYSTNSGNQSPLNLSSIPPPPPLPPFKMSAWKYEVIGDYVRLKSNNNTGGDAEESSSPSDGGESPVVTPFCPSPDVNTKADNFIARFRAGLKLEKMNSVKQRSNLGPEPGPSHEGEGPS